MGAHFLATGIGDRDDGDEWKLGILLGRRLIASKIFFSIFVRNRISLYVSFEFSRSKFKEERKGETIRLYPFYEGGRCEETWIGNSATKKSRENEQLQREHESCALSWSRELGRRVRS